MSDAGLLSLVLYLPVIGAALLVPMRDEGRMRGLSLVVMLVQFALAAMLYQHFDAADAGLQFATRVPWIAD